MASHHHHHLNHTTTCCATCSCTQCCQTPPAPPPHPQQSDHLLQALAYLLLQTQCPQSQQNHYLNQNQTHIFKTFQDQNFASKKHQFYQKHHHQEVPDFLLSSLVGRINALEKSLQNFSRTSNFYSYASCSLKDAAARVIQTHFRAFLVHRSRTLRQLKDLAFIKSSLNSLKLSISNKTHFDYEAVSQKAMDLLLKLDSFQGGDPMTKDGKRSVSRDLVQFLDYIDALALKRHSHLYRNAKNVRVLGGNSSKARILRLNSGEIMEKLRDRVGKLERFSINEEEDDDDVELEGFHQVIDDGENPRISITRKGGDCVTQNRNGGVLVKRQGSQPSVKKTVSFSENGNVYRIISRGNEVSSSGDGSLTDETVLSDDHADIIENKESGGLVEIEEVNLDDEESLQSGHPEKIIRRNLTRQARREIDADYQIQDGDFVFSAPLPEKMESKADLMKKRKGALKIVL